MYFGIFKKDTTDKGAYTTEVRAQIGSGSSAPTPNTAPVAKASANVTSGTAPLAVNFSSAGSSDADGSIAAYAWDLDGDGQFDDSTAQNPSYTYSNVGTYSVKLRVTDNQGAQSVSNTIQITAAPAPAPPVQLADFWLLDAGKFEARVIQALRDALDLDQNEAKDLVEQAEQAPVVVKRGMARADAEKLKAKLVELGAKVELR
jgi:ribosomal protein L7/L12